MALKSQLFCALVFSNIIIASEYATANAFRWHSQQTTEELKDQISHEKSRGVLDSLTSVAQSGAFVWSNHISENAGAKRKKPNSLQQTSSIVSKLHDQIQKSRNNQQLNIDRVDVGNWKDSYVEEQSYHRHKSPWPDHFYEEILAYIAGGAAATSAFSAVVVGTIFATFVVTIGAVTTALFFDDDLEDTYTYNQSDDLDANDFNTKTVIESKDCDLDESFFETTSSNQASLDKGTFDDTTMRELKKCFAGKPSADMMFFTAVNIPNTCSRSLPQYEYSGFGIDYGLLHDDYEVPSEVCDQLIVDEQSVSEEDNVEEPKLIELIWHDSYSTAANSYYTTKMNNNQRKRRARNRKVHVTDQSFDLEDTEREGAMLLSDTFKVTSTAFGLLADAVRFAGESTAATAGGTARIVGGAVKAGGWAVGSLGSAISSDKSDTEEDENLITHVGKKRHRTRKVAGASVKLLGDAIDNVAESLLLAGSATERIAFAAAGAAEGAVRVIEDLTSSLSNAFAREGKNRIVPIKQSQIAPDHSPPSKRDAHDIVTLESPTESLQILSDQEATEGPNRFSDDIDEDDFVNELSDYLFSISSWIFHNTEHIMQDTAGVSSNAPQLLFVFIILYLASVVLLTEKKKGDGAIRTEKAIMVEHNKTKLVPDGIIADEGDTHSTLTIDSTMKRGLDIHSISVMTGRAVHFAVWTAMLPMKLFYMIAVQAYRITFGKKAILLAVHLLGWFFVCQMSQNRAIVVEKKAILAGYKSAVESVGTSLSGRNHLESAFWLNAIISKLWRVNELGTSNIGGLEPLLASSVASIFASRLEESYARPSGVAHVSLASLTFGKSVRREIHAFVSLVMSTLFLMLYLCECKPPIIRDVEIKGINAQESKVYLGLDLVMLLEDAVLMLGKLYFCFWCFPKVISF